MTMNNNQTRRQRRILAQKMYKQSESFFDPIDLNGFAYSNHPNWMTRAFKNNRYIVMINDNSKTSHGIAVRAMIQKIDDTPILNHWSEIQRIKNEIFGKETVAVEYYPSESKLINHHNIYWIFIYPEGILPVPF